MKRIWTRNAGMQRAPYGSIALSHDAPPPPPPQVIVEPPPDEPRVDPSTETVDSAVPDTVDVRRLRGGTLDAATNEDRATIATLTWRATVPNLCAPPIELTAFAQTAVDSGPPALR